ncbi:MAG: type I phosphomannose isomerase catalytic subunit [Pirellulales bacterium]
MPLYPLRFEPIFRRYLWGGRRLGTVLGKPIGEGDDYAESWEIVDRGEDQSRLLSGPLAGMTLGELVRSHGADVFGRHHPQQRFPLLFKLLDAQRTLSVQVHPDDEQAAQLTPPDLGKTEAWVVLAAEPGSVIYAGLKRGFDRTAFEREIARGTCHLCLHSFEPRAGDVVLLPAGTVHALGAGLLIAEIQQSSDTTFRLFDWSRIEPDGRPRPLHVEQALAAIDWRRGPIHPQTPAPTDQPHVERLVSCDKFVLDRRRVDQSEPLGGDERFHLVSVIEGELEIAGDPAGRPLRKGDSMLLPAALGGVVISPRQPTILLDAYLP